MDYRKALERAIIYIENHLSDNIKADEVARVAGYSYYHLNRQFIGALGEGIGGYIRKRRLAEASKKLIYSEKKIINIAFDSGFESPEAFSRAFNSVYNVSPQIYRQNRLDSLMSKKERLDNGLLEHLTSNITVHPKFVELPEIKVVGIRGETTLRDNKLKELWDNAGRLFGKIPNRVPSGRGFGICEACHENTLYTMNNDVIFSEVAGVEVSSFDGVEKPFVRKIIPGGRYAVFTHRGTLRMLNQSFNYIWGTWFLATDEEIDSRKDFEMYDERFLGYDNPNSETDLYIPVK